jgi:hypothetical protein
MGSRGDDCNSEDLYFEIGLHDLYQQLELMDLFLAELTQVDASCRLL